MAKKYTADTFEGAVTGTASGNVAKTGDTMSGDLELGNGSNLILSSNTYPYGRINFAAVGAASNPPYQIVGQSNPGGSSLALRGTGSSTLEDSFVVKSFGLSLYNYAPKPIRIGADSSSNELDDYEEGTWTLSFGYANMGSVTSYAVSAFSGYTWTGRYVKIGRLVHCTFYFGCSGFPWPVNTTSQVFMLESSFPFALDSTTEAVNGTYYNFPGFSSSGTSAAEVTGAIYPMSYTSSQGAGFVADRGYYQNFESPDTDAFNLGPQTPQFVMRGSFQYYTAS